MHIERIVYHKTFNLGNYSSERIGVEFMLNQGEDAKFALEEASRLVHEYHKQSSAGLQHAHIEEQSLPPEPTILPDIQVEKAGAVSLEDQINACTSLDGPDGLKTFSTIARTNSNLLAVYVEKRKQFS